MNTPPAGSRSISPAVRPGFFSWCISPIVCLDEGRPGDVNPIVARLPIGDTPPIVAAAENAKVLLEALQAMERILGRGGFKGQNNCQVVYVCVCDSLGVSQLTVHLPVVSGGGGVKQSDHSVP